MIPQIIKKNLWSPELLHPSAVLRLCFITSFFLHGILVLALQEAFPLRWAVEELRTYRVELIRPPVEDLHPEEEPLPAISRLKEEAETLPPKDQDTISLDTKNEKYVSYARLIKERIRYHWRYPLEAMERLLEGRLLVVFSLGPRGNLIQIRLREHSGYQILDQEALRAITAAAPFPPFPEHVKVSRLNIKASFDYRLTSKK